MAVPASRRNRSCRFAPRPTVSLILVGSVGATAPAGGARPGKSAPEAPPPLSLQRRNGRKTPSG